MINTIDLFAGCGGLSEGFLSSGKYHTMVAVEWDKHPINTLKHRMKTKYSYNNIDEIAIRFDIQRSEELIKGFDDEEYGKFIGIDNIVRREGGSVDIIIGGPPCQAYSVAGRIRDENGMRDDYRNYLFESYLKIVEKYRPRVFVFENVPGILSARPGNAQKLIIDDIKKQIRDINYDILDDIKLTQVDFREYGIPQNRKRIIIVGIDKSYFGEHSQTILRNFYFNELIKYKEKERTVKDSISDLPKLYPLKKSRKVNGKNISYTKNENRNILNHEARYHNLRDISIFKKLTKDIEDGNNIYTNAEALKRLYTDNTGRESSVHKFHVIRWEKPSNTIPAHLYKDGLRHIHPDSEQARSITVREAARLQTFPDDYEFITGTNMDYKMIGNAVPPKFSEKLARAIYKVFFKGE